MHFIRQGARRLGAVVSALLEWSTVGAKGFKRIWCELAELGEQAWLDAGGDEATAELIVDALPGPRGRARHQGVNMLKSQPPNMRLPMPMPPMPIPRPRPMPMP